MLYVLFAILLLLWLLGYAYAVGGAFIHLLLIAAVIVLVLAIDNDKDLPDWPTCGDE